MVGNTWRPINNRNGGVILIMVPFFQVVFAAILEYGYQGDIAIDDVRIFDGECYHVMTAAEMSKKFNVTFTPPATVATPSP